MPHTDLAIIPYLTVSPAADAIEFYKRAFGFEEVSRLGMPDGKVIHAELKIGQGVMFLSDDAPHMGSGVARSPKALGGSTATIHINSPDVDAAFQRAVGAGATAVMPPMDMFWGDRFCKVIDPFGHHWSIATHKEDVTPDEIQRRAATIFTQRKQ